MGSPKPDSKCFVAKIEIAIADKFRQDLHEMGFEISTPPHTLFSAKKTGVSCTLYQSGKVMVQGKNMKDFIEFYLEPNILKKLSFSHPESLHDQTARIGVDESGKGDFYGPLCIAGVYAQGKEIEKLHQMGVKDSKEISDSTILMLAKKIRENFQYHIIAIFPQKYNELYDSFKNLNSLLAWGHASIIEIMVKKTACKQVTIDQFAKEHVVLNALKRKNIDIPIFQRHRAEEDIVVAAASILARAAFVEGLKKLSEEIGFDLPKGGARITVEVGKKIKNSIEPSPFKQIAKLHFKNYQEIMGLKIDN